MKEEKMKQPQGENSEPDKLMIQDSVYYTTYTRKYLNRKGWVKPDAKKVVSFIPGTIRQVFVRSGDKVRMHDKLLVLEAMKMMNTIQSPLEGMIRSVNIKEGDKIPKGIVMIEFE
jgi:biotin carboxyl carrier protein